MEQHPVPQNVTTFQFRLIGDMTIKQFGYLCIGAILCYISYKLPLPFFFTWPLAVFFALLGIGFAFVPIEERPMDVWVLSFFKRIYSPTQYLWSRGARSSSEGQRPKLPPPKATFPAATKTRQVVNVTPRPMQDAFSGLKIHSMNVGGPLEWIKNLMTPKPRQVVPSSPAPTPSSFSLGPIPSIVGTRPQPVVPEVKQEPAAASTQEVTNAQAKSKNLEEKVGELESELAGKDISDSRILDLQKQLTDLLTEKRAMEEELVSLRRKTIASDKSAQTRPAGTVSAPMPSQTSGPTIKIITPETATRAGLPKLTTYPNVVTGIVKDNAGNLLPGVLVTVRDKDDIPLRALKTNKLGQFAASTPLPLGTYLVEVEDPRGRYTFDRAQITVTGAIIPAIEVLAKSQKELERQKLAQQIFGGGNA